MGVAAIQRIKTICYCWDLRKAQSDKLFQELKNIQYHLQKQIELAAWKLRCAVLLLKSDNTLPFLEIRTATFAILIFCGHPNNLENPDPINS